MRRGDFVRDSLLAALDARCEVRRPSRTSDGSGGWTETLSVVASGVACRIEAAEAAVSGETVGTLAGWAGLTMHLPAGADVRIGDRIAVGARDLRVDGVRPADDGSPLKSALVVEEAGS